MAISPEDLSQLSRCVDLAEQAVESGDEPFGSLLVDQGGVVRFSDHNHVAGGDATQHPELAIARWAAANLSPADRAAATVYTSGEHCPMCAAAHGWAGLGRIVYASSSEQLVSWRAELGMPPGPVAPLPIRAVVPGAVVDGPAPEFADRIRALHARSLRETGEWASRARQVTSRHHVAAGWARVDEYFVDRLVGEPAAMTDARAATKAAGLPPIEVSPPHGKLFAMLCRMAGARRVLEFGTLGGYSTIWFADAVGAGGRVTTFEIEQQHADVAAANVERAGLSDRVSIVVGPAAESVRRLIDAGEAPYDFVFIDADKPSNTAYLAAALELAHPGTVIVCDNVARSGSVVDAGDENAHGARAVIEAMGSDPRLIATAIQTVGAKGWDGFAIAIVADGA